MAAIQAPGTCSFCQKTLSKSGMTAHLKTCAVRKAAPPEPRAARRRKQTTFFHLLVEGRYAPEYWMHLEVDGSANLRRLDDFLRAIWLECCGHLSAFHIDGQDYSSDVEGGADIPWDYEEAPAQEAAGSAAPFLYDEFGDDESMDVTLDKVLRPGLRCSYEYDFGTTTTLALRVVATRTGSPAENPMDVLASNDPPVLVCSACGAVAERVCVVCNEEEEDPALRWLCGGCEHEHEGYEPEELYLPVMDSPRVGQCAYGAVV